MPTVIWKLILLLWLPVIFGDSHHHWYEVKSTSTCKVRACCLPKASLECSINLNLPNESCPSSLAPSDSGDIGIFCSRASSMCSSINLMNLVNTSNIEQIRIQKCLLNKSVYTDKVTFYKYPVRVTNLGILHRHFDLVIHGALNVKRNGQLDRIEDFDAIRSKCLLRKLVLNNLGLMRIPNNVFLSCSGVNVIDLSHNKIYYLRKADFWLIIRYTMVEKLILDHNNLHSFAQDVIPDLMAKIQRDLKLALLKKIPKGYVHRHMNQICDLIGVCGSESKKLTLGYIAKNVKRLKIFGFVFHTDIRYAKSRLRVLSLNHNHLTEVPDSIFGLTELNELHLAHNQITASAFSSQGHFILRLLTKLTVFNLEGNQISKVNSKTFYFAVGLTSLNLAYNRLSYLPPGVFARLSKLVHLNLAGNALSQFSDRSNLPALRTLNMSYNYLHSLNRNWGQRWPLLETLDLRNNRITSIAAGVFSSLTHLVTLILTGNLMHNVPAASFLTSPRPLLADRVRLRLFSSATSTNVSPMYRCDCHSVFNAIAYEEINAAVLPSFQYPALVMPEPASDFRCLNTEHRSVSIIDQRRDYAFCSVIDLACPKRPNHCKCCRSADKGHRWQIEKCDCLFRCPAGCHCVHTLEWDQVRVNCHNRMLTTLPQSFIAFRRPNSEQPLVTELLITRADIKMLGSDTPTTNTLCVRGLGHVEVLKVEHSHLQRLHTNAFTCFRRLQSMSLAYNRLVLIPPTPALLANSGKTLQTVDLSHNRLTHVSKKTFQHLDSLVQLNLEENPFRCDCTWEDNFLEWVTNARGQGVNVSLPKSCVPSDTLLRYGDLASVPVAFDQFTIGPACRKMHVAVDKARKLLIGCSTGISALLLTVTLIAILHRRRFAILYDMDKRIKWVSARRLIGLSLPHNRPIDVALVFNERQTKEEHEVVNFIAATGRNLIVRRVAYYMPGALVTDQLDSLAENMAVCLIYVSADLLSDSFLDPFCSFLRKCRKEGGVHLVPIYPEQTDQLPVAQGANYAKVHSMLSQYNGLRWRGSHFWERLRLVLPPGRQIIVQDQESNFGESDCPLLDLTHMPKLADLCVVSHESQLHLVRDIYDRYRGSLQLIHYRHGALFGLSSCQSSKNGRWQSPETFLEANLSCRQIVLVVSPELLNDAEAFEAIVNNIQLRLERLSFVGSVILLKVAIDAVNLIRNEPLARLLADGGDFIVQIDIDKSSIMPWAGLDSALACSLPSEVDRQLENAMDSEEYNQLFYTDRHEVHSALPTASRFIASSLEWRRNEEMNENNQEMYEDDDHQPLISL